MQPYPFSKILEVAQYVIRNGHTGPYSTGEALAGALAAGNEKVVREMGYSFESAVDQIGERWCKDVFSVRMAAEVFAYKRRRAERGNA